MSRPAKYKFVIENLPWTVGTKQLLAYFVKFGEIHDGKVFFDVKTGFSVGQGRLAFTRHVKVEELQEPHNIHGQDVKVIMIKPNPENQSDKE